VAKQQAEEEDHRSLKEGLVDKGLRCTADDGPSEKKELRVLKT